MPSECILASPQAIAHLSSEFEEEFKNWTLMSDPLLAPIEDGVHRVFACIKGEIKASFDLVLG